MRASLNTVALAGEVAKEPEFKSTDRGTFIGEVIIHVDNGYLGNDGWVDRIQMVKFTCFNKRAKWVEDNVHPGDFVLITGQVSGREYDERVYIDIVAQDVRKMRGGGKSRPAPAPAPAPAAPASDDDLPF